MCIIPYATQMGEISFCAYNTGIGWRNIIENMYKTHTVAEWYRENGKHGVYAGGKNVELETTEHSLVIRADDAERVRDREEDIPMTAADEERMRRKAERDAQKAKEIFEEMALGKKPSKIDLIRIEVLNRQEGQVEQDKEMTVANN
jgi:hypothetical protein